MTSYAFALIIDAMNVSEKAATLLSCLPNDELQNQNVVYVKLAAAGCVRDAVSILNLDESDYSLFLNEVVCERRALN